MSAGPLSPDDSLQGLLEEACGPVFPGCSLAVWREGKPWLSRSAGTLSSALPDDQDDAAPEPVTPDSVYDVASVTKARLPSLPASNRTMSR